MKMRKIVILFMFSLMILSGTVYGKYTYYFEEVIVELSRDSYAPVCQVTYSTVEQTNENVIVTITSNKEIEQVSGFELSEDKKTLTKEVSENEKKVVTIRDFSGNCTEIEYQVNNIDKEAPKIFGCENGGSYLTPLWIEYSDNNEIESITIDQYEDTLMLACQNIYYDCSEYYGTGRTKSEITLTVNGHPLGTKKYKYYLNDKLYATSAETEYRFTGLKEGTQYNIKVQALDSLGNVLDEKSVIAKTSYYVSITSNKTENQFEATLNQIDSAVAKIRYAVWNVNDDKNVIWKQAEIVDNQSKINFSNFSKSFYPAYAIHAYLYNENDEILDIVEFSVDFATYYQKQEKEENQYEITQAGKYQIKVKDFAGNETVYEIKVK